MPMTVRAMKAGASDFLTKSFRDEDLLTAVTHPLHRSRTLAPDTHPPAAVTPDAADDRRTDNRFAEIVGHRATLRSVPQQVELVATTDATVLIDGGTGTGKELIARALHHFSARRTLNCAAIPPDLLESELSGPRKRRLHRGAHAAPGAL